MTTTTKSPNTRGKRAASKKALEKTVVAKKTSGRKTKLAAVTEKKRLEERGVHRKSSDVPIVRGSGVLAVAFRKSLSESSSGRKKWDMVTRQAVEQFDGTWDTATVFPYLMRKMGKNARFLCTNGDDETSDEAAQVGAAAAAAAASSSSASSRGTHVWFEMSQEQIIAACQIKFNRIAARNELDSNDGDHDVDMMQLEEANDDDDDKKTAAVVTLAPGAEASAGEPSDEANKAVSSTAIDTCATAEEAAAAPPRQATFFDRVRGMFGWGGVKQP